MTKGSRLERCNYPFHHKGWDLFKSVKNVPFCLFEIKASFLIDDPNALERSATLDGQREPIVRLPLAITHILFCS